VTEYCAMIGMHSTVQGDKLLYGYVPDPFPPCRTGSGHARVIVIKDILYTGAHKLNFHSQN